MKAATFLDNRELFPPGDTGLSPIGDKGRTRPQKFSSKLSRFAVFLLLLLSSIAALRADEPTRPTVTDLLKRLIKSNPKSIIGWERIQCKNDALVDLKEISAVLDKLDIAAVTKVVGDQTDYKCLVGKDYFLVLPKESGLPVGGGLIKRRVTFPSATNIRSFEYLGRIEAVNKDTEDFSFGPSMFYSKSEVVETISMDAGTSELYLILNQLARKLNARCWIVSDGVDFDAKTQEPIMPPQLNFGAAAFYRTADALPYYGIAFRK